MNWDTRRARSRGARFDGVVENSLDAVSNRDFVLDYLSAASICAMHLSRLGAEIVLWSSEEFGFLALGDSFASGSSLMPQKKNPDAAELLRAKAPRVAAHLVALLGVMHALPLAYNKDMQEDKEHAVRRGRHARPVPRGRGRDAADGAVSTASAWPAPPRTSSSPPPTSPTCWCAGAFRSASRTRSSAGLVRHAVDEGKQLRS